MTVIVNYWPPHGSQVGHVSVSVLGTAGSTYISWWPAEGTKTTTLEKLKSLYLGVNGAPFSLEQDIAGEGNKLPLQTELEGLNEAKIIDWWNREFRPNQSKWSLLNTSCAQVAVYALRAGDADRFINTVSGFLSSWQFTYWKPMEVHLYAQHIRSGHFGR